MKINNLKERLERIEEYLTQIATGEFEGEIEVTEEDALASVEYGLNYVLEEFASIREKDLKKTRQMEEQLLKIQAQETAIQELSTPIIKIWDDILTLPVVGVVDSKRSADMMDSLLNEVVETQSKCVIIDITGVNVVDTRTADHFIKMVKSVNLLGAECIITGISPEVAQTLTNIGVDLKDIKTRRNLQHGLQECLSILNMELSAKRVSDSS